MLRRTQSSLSIFFFSKAMGTAAHSKKGRRGAGGASDAHQNALQQVYLPWQPRPWSLTYALSEAEFEHLDRALSVVSSMPAAAVSTRSLSLVGRDMLRDVEDVSSALRRNARRLARAQQRKDKLLEEQQLAATAALQGINNEEAEAATEGLHVCLDTEASADLNSPAPPAVVVAALDECAAATTDDTICSDDKSVINKEDANGPSSNNSTSSSSSSSITRSRNVGGRRKASAAGKQAEGKRRIKAAAADGADGEGAEPTPSPRRRTTRKRHNNSNKYNGWSVIQLV